jgi:[ribosomal protein S5]-alanine N-acetyltransferase
VRQSELIDIRQARLSTARLTLEPLTAAHVDEALATFADPAMSRYMSVDLSVRENACAMLERRLAYSGPPALGHWAIRESKVFVGLAHLRPSSELPRELVEIGWFVDASQTNRGIAVEAGAALLEYGLSTLGLPAIWALIDVRNGASKKVAERLGFIRVGAGHHYGALHEISVALPGFRPTP